MPRILDTRGRCRCLCSTRCWPVVSHSGVGSCGYPLIESSARFVNGRGGYTLLVDFDRKIKTVMKISFLWLSETKGLMILHRLSNVY
jgi:hypothetical protein